MFLFELNMIHFNFPEKYTFDVYQGIISIPGNLWLISLMEGVSSEGLFSINTDGIRDFSKFCGFNVWTLRGSYCYIGFNSQIETANKKAEELGISLDDGKISYNGKLIEKGEFCFHNYSSFGRNIHIDVNPEVYFCTTFNLYGDYETRLFKVMFGENPGVVFWHKDYGFKSINPDQSKNWIYSCLSVDGLTCLAVHDTGGCIFDSPFFS